MDTNMTDSMFVAFTSVDGGIAVKTTAALSVIGKLATERLWPASSADGASHGGMCHLEGLILLPALRGPPLALPTLQHQSQHPSTPPPQEIGEHGDGTLGKHPCDEPADMNTGDTSGAGTTLLITITPARQEVEFLYLLRVANALNFSATCNLPCTRKAVAQLVSLPRTNTSTEVRL